MEMRVAFAGSSGTGKTTLAKWIAETYNLEMNPVGSRSVAAVMGFASPYDVDAAGKRAEIQKQLLMEKVLWEEAHPSFVTDRTTFDNLVYTMLHDVKSITRRTMVETVEAFRIYTHVIYYPVDAFCDPGNDDARVKDRVYHELYDFALWGLLDRYAPAGKQDFMLLDEEGLEERKLEISRLLEPCAKKKVR